ncbi:MAG: helix-turn-helix transcriptional regulator, partial [Ornithinibacter sp.]
MVNADANVLESRTRDRVLRVVSQEGPVSITTLVERLGLTETAVRRQVDALHADGLVEPREATGPRRRGRPAKSWVLTDRGHRALVSDYDHLAGEALRFLSDTVGAEAVHQFAEHRVASLEQRYADRVDAAGDDPTTWTLATGQPLDAAGLDDLVFA